MVAHQLLREDAVAETRKEPGTNEYFVLADLSRDQRLLLLLDQFRLIIGRLVW